MGIAIPRPQMRAKERRVTEWKLARHAELMGRFEAEGHTRMVASAMAFQIVKTEKTPRNVLRPNG